MAFGWTDEKSDLALRLWQEGQSGSEIAVNPSICTTRNAVIAHIHRLRLKGVPARSARPNMSGGSYRTHRTRTKTSAPKRKREPRPPKPKSITPPTPKVDWTQPTITIVVPEDQRRQLLGPGFGFEEGGALDSQCRYINGDLRDPDWHYCHQERVPGLSWCMDHAKLCLTPPQPARAYVPGVIREPIKESV